MNSTLRSFSSLSILDGIETALGVSSEDLNNIVEKISKKSGKQYNIMTVELRRKAFYGDYDKFTESKRFERFIDFVKKETDDFFSAFKIRKTNAETGELISTVSGKNYFKEFIRDAIDCYTFKNCEDDDLPEAEYSMVNIIGKIPERSFSNLWSINATMEEAGITVRDNKKPFALREVEKILYSVNETGKCVFDTLYNDAFIRACYDYISSVALIKHLNENNWFFQLKSEMTSEQLLIIMTKIFEYTLHTVEDYAVCGLVYSAEDIKGEAFFKDIYDFMRSKCENEEKETVKDAKIKELTALIESKDKKIEELAEQNKRYRKNAAFTDTSRQDNIALQRELKRIKAEYDKLEEKYNSLVSQTMQQTTLIEEEDEEETEIVFNEANKFKHIVFIRDKKYDGCVILRKLAEYYPNAKITNGIAAEINAKATDLIVALTSYTCHSTYWGAKSVSDRKAIPMIDIKKTNLGAIVVQIDKAFEKEQ